MRNLALSLAAAVMLFAAPASTIAQQFEIGPGGVRVEPYRHGYYRHGYGRYGYAPDCRALRRACLYKGELGETGQGNCERYRRLCR